MEVQPTQRQPTPAHARSLPVGLRLQVSAPFGAKPKVRFVHNGDVHFHKQPCPRCETLVGAKQAL